MQSYPIVHFVSAAATCVILQFLLRIRFFVFKIWCEGNYFSKVPRRFGLIQKQHRLNQLQSTGGIGFLKVRVSSKMLSVNEDIWDRFLLVKK